VGETKSYALKLMTHTLEIGAESRRADFSYQSRRRY